MATDWQIAQLNIARAVAPLDDERLAGFVDLLDDVNALAERSAGFVWRLQTDTGNATDVRVNDDPRVIVNLTMWASIDDLRAYAYRSEHKGVFARRFEWFERWPGPSQVLWWQPTGTIPDVRDGLRRLALLVAAGPTRDAFTFRHRFPEPVRQP